MRRLLILAAVATVAVAASGCRCGGGLFRRNACYCVTEECSTCCDGSGNEHDVYFEGSEPVFEESIPVPRGR